MVDGWYSMIKVVLLGLVLIAGTQQPKTELKAMDEFFDKLLQNATPTKENCLKYEDCPEWDGNPDTKVWYDLMKLKNGAGTIAKSDFNWNVHLYLCHQNELLDSINGKGSFEKRAIQSAKDGWIPCPIGVNPHWDYDWENHILMARAEKA